MWYTHFIFRNFTKNVSVLVASLLSHVTHIQSHTQHQTRHGRYQGAGTQKSQIEEMRFKQISEKSDIFSYKYNRFLFVLIAAQITDIMDKTIV